MVTFEQPTLLVVSWHWTEVQVKTAQLKINDTGVSIQTIYYR